LRVACKGVIAGNFDDRGETLEKGTDGLGGVFAREDIHLAFFTVDEFGGMDDDAAEGFNDRLVAEADTEDRDFAGEVGNDVDGDAGGFGVARAGRDDDVGRCQGFDFGKCDGIVSEDLDVRID